MSIANAKQLRHQGILEILQDVGTATVAELGGRLGVTEMTIRRDLEVLDESGALKRFHGGAKLASSSGYEPPFAVREQSNAEQKRSIALRVAQLVDDGDTVILDGGSTGVAIAEALVDRHITVCPLSLRVAWVLARSTTVELLMPSGSVRAGELSLSGAETTDYLRGHRFDRYVMTASGIDALSGLTEWNVEDAAVKRVALAVSTTTIAAIDSSKYNRPGFVHVCAINAPDIIVMDEGITDMQRHELSQLGNRIALC